MASNSILKLQVDDKQYESSLKSAQQGLQALMNALRNSGKSFSDLDKNTTQYVRALGNMEATAKTTRGRIGEMSSAFVELSQVEKQLTDQERQSPVGKALTESLEQLKHRAIEAKQELADLDKQLTSQKAPDIESGIKSSGLFGGGKLDGMLQVFGGNVMTKVAGMATGLVTEMGDAIKQGVELARQGEGIRIAFERLGRGDILDGLRQATHGTVTDLELMKAAVQFNDFKLPLDQLGTMLAFAQQKAKDTGQSVDYLVQSIVTGLGRKSLMILDNLGLSATEIKERMKDTGDMTKAVGEIIREQMAKAGDYVETAADRAAQANVNMQNKMEELGRKFAPLQEASNSLWTSMKIGILDVIGGPLTDLLNKLTEAGRLRNALNNINGDGIKGNTQVANQLKQLQAARKSGASQYMLNTMQSGVIEGYNRQINEREQAIKDWKSWRSGNRSEGLQQHIGQWRDKYGTNVNAIKAEADAYRTMLAEYRKGVKDIMTPVKVDVKTDNAGGKGGNKIINKTEIQFADDSIMAQEKLVQKLTQQWKTASAEMKDGYLEQLNKAKAKLEEMAKGPDLDKLFPDLSSQKYHTGTVSRGDALIQSIRADMGRENMDVDQASLKNIMTMAMKEGLDTSEIDTNGLLERIFNGEDIPTDFWNGLMDRLNEALQDFGREAYDLDEKGNLKQRQSQEGKKEKKEEKEDKKYLSEGLSQLSGGLNGLQSGFSQLGIDLGEGFGSVVQGLSGISSILMAIQTIIGAIEAISAVDSIIPFAGGGTVPKFADGGVIPLPKFENGGIIPVPKFETGGIVPRLIGKAAGGMLIPGNSFSGDNLRMPVDGGRGVIGVNSGELILNMSSQNNLASALKNAQGLLQSINVDRSLSRSQQSGIATAVMGGGMQNLHLETYLDGRAIRIVLNNESQGRLKGKYVTSRRG